MNPSVFSTISFPELGISLNPPRSFPVGPLTVNFYGLIIAIGLLLAVFYGLRRSKEFGLLQEDILDGVLGIVPLAIICARAYYCVFEWNNLYADDPISVLYIWKGGLAIYGGVIGAAIGVIVFAKLKKVSLPAVLDLVSLGFLIGQSIGRWGNFFNREAFGAATDSFLRMGLFNTQLNAWEYYHPTFLYESVWNAVGFVALHLLSKRRRYDGQIALGYVAWYGLGRTLIEGLRVDSLYLGPFRVSQLLAAVSCLIALIVLTVMTVKKPDPAKLYGRVMAHKWAQEAEAAEAVAEETEEIAACETADKEKANSEQGENEQPQTEE